MWFSKHFKAVGKRLSVMLTTTKAKGEMKLWEGFVELSAPEQNED
jgi:hypothetical protein